MIHTPKHPILLLVAFLSLTLSTQSHGSPPTGSDDTHMSATLLSTAIPAPGDSFLLAINLTIADDWHTYWPGINDTGYGLSINIDPIPGVTFADPYFPTPTRHLAPGGILDHIYEHTIQIIIPVTTSPEITTGTNFTIKATINALVCKDLCIPESTQASIDLLFTDYPVRDSIQEITDAYNNRATDLVNAKITWIFTSDPDDPEPSVLLEIKDATHYQFFPDSKCTNLANLIAQGDTNTEYLRIDFDRRYEDDLTIPAKLSGRLRVKVLDTWQEFNINYTQQTQTESSP